MKAGQGKRPHSYLGSHLQPTFRRPLTSKDVLGQDAKLFEFKLTTFDPFHYWTHKTHTHA